MNNSFLLNEDGKRHNRFIVVSSHHHKKNGKWYAKCVCDCGKEFYAILSNINRNITKSCGCDRYSHETMTKGKTNRLYRIWRNIISRCKNPNRKDFYRYGGRGIDVCEEWNDFILFKKWAETNGYSDELTIDRMDNNKGYSPENCRWATTKEQGINRRTTRMITHDGKTMPLKMWAEKIGLSGEGLRYRFDVLHLTIEEALKPKRAETLAQVLKEG